MKINTNTPESSKKSPTKSKSKAIDPLEVKKIVLEELISYIIQNHLDDLILQLEKKTNFKGG